MSDKPVILLGIDAGDILLIERWAQEGLLPSFSSLLKHAAYGRLDTPARVLQGSIWPSFATGCNPGKHGSYFLMQMQTGTNQITRVRADHLLRPPFWTWLEGDSEEAVIVDVPKSMPSPDLNGVQIVEWGALDHYWRFATTPRDLEKRILKEFGRHPLSKELWPPRNITACLRLQKTLVEGVFMKHRLNLSLVERYQPRVFLSIFGETHPAGHYFWRFYDERHPAHESHPDASRALLRVYNAVDRAVGEVFDKYSHGANCFVFSGHGMTADYNPYYVLDDLLCKMGLTVRQGDYLATPAGLTNRLLNVVRDCIPASSRHFLNQYVLPLRLRERLMLSKVFQGLEFSKSKAFALPSDLQGFIRINLKGREPGGTVQSSEYDDLCDHIEEELHGLENISNGEPVVEEVFRPRVLYAGAENIDALPDLCVRWNNDAPIAGVRSARHGILKGHRKILERSGNHRPEGFFFAAGPDIDTSTKNSRGNLLDIAPTIFKLLNKEIPGDWDGVPLKVVR